MLRLMVVFLMGFTLTNVPTIAAANDQNPFAKPIREGDLDQIKELAKTSDFKRYLNQNISEISEEEISFEFRYYPEHWPDLKLNYRMPPIVFASALGELEIVKYLYDAGAKIDSWSWHDADPKDQRGFKEFKDKWIGTSLTHAIAGGHFDVARFLLDQGADVNKAATYSTLEVSPLAIAVIHENEEWVQLLIKKGADINLPITYSKKNILHLLNLTSSPDKAKIQLALKYGADPNTTAGVFDTTPIVYAAKAHDDNDVIKMLLDAGADVNFNNEWGTALINATGRGRLDMMKLLIEREADLELLATTHAGGSGYEEGVDCPLSSRYGCSALIYGIAANNIEAVNLLIDAGADLNSHFFWTHKKEYSDGTPLFEAVRSGRFEMVKLLVDAGANIEICSFSPANKCKGTALVEALDSKKFKIASYLLDVGVPLRGQYSDYAVKLAIQSDAFNVMEKILKIYERERQFLVLANSVKMVKLFLDAGADIDESPYGYRGKTPLMAAIVNGRIDVALYLIKSGADPSLTDFEGKTALQYAVELEQNEVIKELLKGYENLEEALLLSAQKGILSTVNEMIIAGANVDTTDIDGRTPLFMASKEGHLEIVVRLIEANANLDMVDNNGDTALKVAFKNQHLKIVEALIKAGASTEI